MCQCTLSIVRLLLPLLVVGLALLVRDVVRSLNLPLAINNARLVNRPEEFHGQNVTDGPFFEGWYYKTVFPDEAGSVIFIPGVFIPKAVDVDAVPGAQSDEARAQPHAFVMVIRDPKTVACLYYTYPLSEFSATPGSAEKGGAGFSIQVGKSTFSAKGMKIDLDVADLVWTLDEDIKEFTAKALRERAEQHPDLSDSFERLLFVDRPRTPLSIRGSVAFSSPVRFPSSRLYPTVMGPFAYLPAMECYHGVVALHHSTTGSLNFYKSDGSLEHDLDLTNGTGYIEKDHGINFPQNWIWIQTASFKKDRGSSLMVSVADVPLLSREHTLFRLVNAIPYIGPAIASRFHFTGFLVTLYHASTKQTHNLSLYTLSRIESIDISAAAATSAETPTHPLQTVRLVLSSFDRSKKLTVIAKRPLGAGVPLPGPIVRGNRMGLIVEETLVVDVDVVLTAKGQVVFEDTGSIGGMEVVGDIASLVSGI
ncbi:hypothetical protein HDU87_002447 [Geranomyces variabilis]|uniref:Uncharacterized protein n=1 Tax=Geranomyces variabilis TaxID=109894 RepID=A0AAD5TL54_9FUNG|nr:hypothetical protein HDU87_002447 [Geranomyces variabilis]